jgi:RNA polymerase sigma-70 factor (ECF subfamily)
MQLASPSSPPDPLAELARRHAEGVFRYLRSMVGDAETARELVQDTFLRVGKQAGEVGPGLVFAAARSSAIDYLRRRRTRGGVEVTLDERVIAVVPAAESHRPDRDAELAELRADLLAALADLSEEQRTVFHLIEIEGLSYEQVARVLGIPPGTIASRKHHAVRKLREALRRCGHGA